MIPVVVIPVAVLRSVLPVVVLSVMLRSMLSAVVLLVVLCSVLKQQEEDAFEGREGSI